MHFAGKVTEGASASMRSPLWPLAKGATDLDALRFGGVRRVAQWKGYTYRPLRPYSTGPDLPDCQLIEPGSLTVAWPCSIESQYPLLDALSRGLAF